jgi:MFS family permease
VNLWRDPKARLILMANFLLVVGSGVTFIAVPWLLVHQPSGEALYGGTNAILTLLIFLLLPYLGKAIDRNPRKNVLLIYFVCAIAINLFVTAAILVQGHVESWHLLTVFSLGSFGFSVYYPAQFAFNQEVISPDQYAALSGAIEVQWQAGAMVAGGLASFLIGRVPLPAILLFDAATYVAGFALIAMIPYKRAPWEGGSVSAWKMMFEGVTYLRQRPRLSVVIFGSFLPFLALMVGNYLAPIFVKDVLQAGPAIYALGEITYGVGAVAAGLTVPALNRRAGLIPTLLVTVSVFAVAVVVNPILPAIWVLLVSFVFQGWGNAGSRVARTTLILQTVPNAIVGRVTLFYSALERLLRSALLALATFQVATVGSKAGYWMLGAVAACGWLMIFACRKIRPYQIEPETPIGEAPKTSVTL